MHLQSELLCTDLPELTIDLFIAVSREPVRLPTRGRLQPAERGPTRHLGQVRLHRPVEEANRRQKKQNMLSTFLKRPISARLFSVVRRFSSDSGQSSQSAKKDSTKKDSARINENEKYIKLRFEQLQRQNNKSEISYPHKFESTLTVEQFVKKFEHLAAGESSKNEIVKLSGRIFSIRLSGKKLRFLDLHQNESRVQIKADSREYDQSFEKFETDFDVVRRGDVVGVTGYPCRTKMGELSVVPVGSGFEILAPSLRILPAGTLEKPDNRYRRRYLDLMLNPVARQVFKARSEVIRSIREFLDERDFLEVETPILGSNVGGASATPFRTRHLELDMDMFLRFLFL